MLIMAVIHKVNPLDMLVAACEVVDANSRLEPHRPPDLGTVLHCIPQKHSKKGKKRHFSSFLL
jgi:hypothetical protein